MAKHKTTRAVKHDGKLYKPGKYLELNDEQAEALEAAGAIEKSADAKKSGDAGKSK